MIAWKDYHLAKSLEDALTALHGEPGPNRLVAGGTDLLLDVQQGRQPPPHTLVDVNAIAEMCALEVRDGKVFVGAALPLNRIIASPLVQHHAHALYQACSLIGGPQVRNVATLGGNVGHALPAADGAIALLGLDAVAHVYDAGGYHRRGTGELYAGPGRSALNADQILVAFSIPMEVAGCSSAFCRVMRPQGVAIAILNMAVWVQADGEVIQDVRIAAGPAGKVPFRATAAEAVLRGQAWSLAVLDEAIAAFLSEARFRTSPHRATFAYRQHLAGVLLRETLSHAWQQARAEG
ncbi:MAG: FAD binding domain-containing protein [Anaerolineales bacterium]|nr:FAD binding domain-containing protein [Anaerolineales bacterium]